MGGRRRRLVVVAAVALAGIAGCGRMQTACAADDGCDDRASGAPDPPSATVPGVPPPGTTIRVHGVDVRVVSWTALEDDAGFQVDFRSPGALRPRHTARQAADRRIPASSRGERVTIAFARVAIAGHAPRPFWVIVWHDQCWPIIGPYGAGDEIPDSGLVDAFTLVSDTTLRGDGVFGTIENPDRNACDG